MIFGKQFATLVCTSCVFNNLKKTKMNRFKKIILLLFILTITQTAFANIAMPGYWNTGTGRTFFPFFKEDSIYFGKIQMKEELITIQLYKGFAVVKGVYKMQNLSSDNILLRVGFPINGTLDHPLVNNIMFEELYNLNVTINGSQTQAFALSEYVRLRTEKYGKVFPFPEVKNSVQSLYADNSNWYIWEANFKANEITEIVVYYILNTNDASQLEGYTKNYSNCFAYILESGEAWGKNIEKGKIILQLMDDLSEDDIEGVYPASSFNYYEGNYFIYDFENLNPINNNNIIFRYWERDEKFNIETITAKADEYFSLLNSMDVNQSFKAKELSDDKNDFEVHTTASSPIVFIVGGIVVIGLLIYGLVAWIF